MKLSFNKFFAHQHKREHEAEKLSLSDFFPEDTVYFYAYPAGEDSNFYNLVSPQVEEIVAARANACAGNAVHVINFSATRPSEDLIPIFVEAGVLPDYAKSVIVAPEKLGSNLVGRDRNEAVKNFLKESIPKGKLVMAQPFDDQSIRDLFLIDPDVTIWLNDKNNMSEYISAELLPKKYGVFENGGKFLKAVKSLVTPIVIKVTSSSAGDGVFICQNDESLLQTAKKLRSVTGTISAEEYINTSNNFGIQFGIDYRGHRPRIIAVSKQITTKDGEFLGGIIHNNFDGRGIERAKKYIEEKIIPFAFKKGWYGIGCFDVLIDNNNQPKFIDANFRMTGMSAFLLSIDSYDRNIDMLTFGATHKGDDLTFRNLINQLSASSSSEGFLKIVALSRIQGLWRMNAGILFKSKIDLKDKIEYLKSVGFDSVVFNEPHTFNAGI